MTDRVNMLYVILEEDIRTDDIEPVMMAMMQMKGVAAVKKHITTPEDTIAQTRVRSELGKKLFEVIYPNAKVG